MLPVAFSMRLDPTIYKAGGDQPEIYAKRCWQAGCALTFIGGLFELAGTAVGWKFRDWFSKAGLYAPIAAVGFVWLGFSPLISVNADPLVGILPFAMTFTGFFANKGKGVYIAGVTALQIFAVGTAFKWMGALKWPASFPGNLKPTPTNMWGSSALGADPSNYGTVSYQWYKFAGRNKMEPFVALDGFGDIASYITVILPVAIQSFVETMENVEAAKVEGDHYNIVEVG